MTSAAAAMEVAAQIALARDRAQVPELPQSETTSLVYALGFAAGADWAVKQVQMEVEP